MGNEGVVSCGAVVMFTVAKNGVEFVKSVVVVVVMVVVIKCINGDLVR